MQYFKGDLKPLEKVKVNQYTRDSWPHIKLNPTIMRLFDIKKDDWLRQSLIIPEQNGDPPCLVIELTPLHEAPND